jgi:hypothetical protein
MAVSLPWQRQPFGIEKQLDQGIIRGQNNIPVRRESQPHDAISGDD